MVVVDAVILEKAVRGVRALERWGHVRAAFLFGSQVQGGTDEWSDIDVAAFVEGAEQWDFHRLSRACADAQRRGGRRVELHILPAASYESPLRASFSQYILQHGMRLDLNGFKSDAA